ncbi:poly-beta-1,6-N-acetyl-D-glucosamine biosynthesis protein PgaD [Acinetobacter terrae]|jgi:biofilm PGA synthesis protein PgaD|uniref:Poly-beta-1,6-N-acetyl-D-glucosamine biosynthesis protein PgaD n=1 Tax=Acinetobacter terrae TaxID=2731247 RepID=A0A4R0ER23_9GAMM|nr:poly-beta-1,6-N-acetyl-D-glucosamine biosynthesis protein PgaD [Acinetobacter terrae]NNG76514.1 poly-beta-1,6-N-acetyl-D-glucosamine biosynthesis protein PgaD [Acinetobacter terrae]NNH15611.1 poly-beta-1,6-N-acetyl-D-glucosamine biosynthesis protein PgaD [Acinetobacter terrae]NNH87912.1 poly-beta-1,6-N-acetyl-D-glucosamine biosynthesis protein PgaD [Acinetobacter terrae]OAL85345.1 poly-beta-1,6-N-acetyl-D-glucosamine biosynthesis protein PgaD [Acinetobacter terrae]TCB62334.1 poly-beta-1,6-N
MTNVNKYYLIEDESKLELPEYIDRPEYVRNKSMGYSLQIVGWFIFMWLFMPVITMFFWWVEGKTIYQQMVIQAAPNSQLSLMNIIAMIAIFICVLLLWATYNWARFHGEDRRRAPLAIDEKQLASSFKVNTVDILNMQLAKNLTLYYDEQGKLEFFEVNHQLKKRISA